MALLTNKLQSNFFSHKKFVKKVGEMGVRLGEQHDFDCLGKDLASRRVCLGFGAI